MTINCKGELIDLSQPRVMGILNITPDSFYDGGNFVDENAILTQVEKMLNDGATFIDVGGYSTRPGADEVSIEEENLRITNAIDIILNAFPNTLISVDTFRSEIAQGAIDKGACMVNDISAGQLDKKMMQTVARLQVPYVMMHSRGTPKTMQTFTQYENLIGDIIKFFSERILKAILLKINDLIIDPGFGFAKTLEQNYELLKDLRLLEVIDLPILCGVSRKSMIYKTLNCTPNEALNGTTALHIIALQNGASILRVHDVKEAVECIKLNEQLIQS